MRAAMERAEVGDDVLGDDQTVKRLEAVAAERMGKEAALFVASGTMANLVSLLSHCNRADEAIVGHMAHIVLAELGGAAGLAGVQIRSAHNDEHGRLDPEEVRSLIRHGESSAPRTALVCLENTHNWCNGSALPASYTERCQTQCNVSPLHFMKERKDKPSPGHTYRMSKGNGASIHIDDLPIKTKRLFDRQILCCKCLIYLDQLDIL